MPSQALKDIIQRVDELAVEEQATLLEYLEDTIVVDRATSRPVVQLGGVLGSLEAPQDSDVIADALEELRQERATQFESKWS